VAWHTTHNAIALRDAEHKYLGPDIELMEGRREKLLETGERERNKDEKNEKWNNWKQEEQKEEES
jgi:hypothetical protein